jgi:biotin synthase
MPTFKVSSEIQEFVDRAFADEGFESDELVRMLQVKPYSPDYYLMQWAARELVWQAADGEAILHAQIGIDAYPCPMDCLGCSFASVNNRRPEDEYEMPLDEIIDYAKKYVEQGANTLTLMITEPYDREQYLEYICAVREAVGPELPIMANMGDFDEEFARRLYDASVHSMFHSVRMGEGQKYSKIPVERRFETMAAARSAGLKISGGIEGIGPEFDDEEIAQMMLRYQAFRPEQSFAGGLLKVPDTAGEDAVYYGKARMATYEAAYRFLGGLHQRYGGANCGWAEVGTNPRDHSSHTEIDGIITKTKISVPNLRECLEEDGYTVRFGPVDFWN